MKSPDWVDIPAKTYFYLALVQLNNSKILELAIIYEIEKGQVNYKNMKIFEQFKLQRSK